MNNTIGELASRYIERRDNFVKRYQHRHTGIFAGSVGGPMAFNDLVTDHAMQFAAEMPPLSLPQWEAVSELASSYLAHLRMIEQNRGKA